MLPILILKACSCVRASLRSLHVPSGFDRRAGSEVHRSRILPQVAVASADLVEDRAGFREARARARCKLGLLLCSVAVTALSGAGLVVGSEGLEQEP